MMKKILYLMLSVVFLGITTYAQDTTHIQPVFSSTFPPDGWTPTADSTNADENWDKTNYLLVKSDENITQEQWLVSKALITFEDIDAGDGEDTTQTVSFEYYYTASSGNAHLRVYLSQDGSIDYAARPADQLANITLNGGADTWYNPGPIVLPNLNTGKNTSAKLIFIYETDVANTGVDLVIDNVTTDTTTTSGGLGNVYDEDFEDGIVTASWDNSGNVAESDENWGDFYHVRIANDDNFNQQEWFTSPEVYIPDVAATHCDYNLDFSYYIKNATNGTEGVFLKVITATDTFNLSDLRGNAAGIYNPASIDLSAYADSTVKFAFVFNSLAVNVEDFYLTSFHVYQVFNKAAVAVDAQISLDNFDSMVAPLPESYDNDVDDNTGITEGFWADPPMNWSITGSSNTTWERVSDGDINPDPISTNTHDYYAYIDTSGADGSPISEVLASNSFTVSYPSVGADYILSFDWATETNLNAGTNTNPDFGSGVDYDFADITVEISINGGTWTQIWQEDDEEVLEATTSIAASNYFYPWVNFNDYLTNGERWYQANIDISSYINNSTTSIEARFTYTGDGVNSGFFALDNFYIMQTQNPDYILEAAQPFTIDKASANYVFNYAKIPETQLQNPYLPGAILTNLGVTDANVEQLFAHLKVNADAEEIIGYAEFTENAITKNYIEIDNLQTAFEDSLTFTAGNTYRLRYDSPDGNINDAIGPVNESTTFEITNLDYAKHDGTTMGTYVPNESKGIGTLLQFFNKDIITSVDVVLDNSAATEFNYQILKVDNPLATTGQVIYTSPLLAVVNAGSQTHTFDFDEIELNSGYYIFMFNQLSDVSLDIVLDNEGTVYRQETDGTIYRDAVSDDGSVEDEGDIWMDVKLKPNTAPTIITADYTTTIIAGNEFKFEIEGFDADGDLLEWYFTGTPDWLTTWVTTVDSSNNNGYLMGTPTADDLGTSTFTIDMYDERGLAADNNSLTVEIKVVSQSATFAAPYGYIFDESSLDLNWSILEDVNKTGATNTWILNNANDFESVSTDAKAQNEWLISPAIYIPESGAKDFDTSYTFSFKWKVNDVDNFNGGVDGVLGSGVDGDGNFADLTVLLSTDNGKTWPTTLWKEDDVDLVSSSTDNIYGGDRWGYDNNTYYTSEFDLNTYRGDTVLIAFQYESKNANGITATFTLDEFEVAINDAVDIDLVGYTENPSIPERQIDLVNGHDVTFYFINNGQSVPDNSSFTINIPALGIYEEHALTEGMFTDDTYEHIVNIDVEPLSGNSYNVICDLTLGDGTAVAGNPVTKTITVSGTALTNSGADVVDAEAFGKYDGLGAIYNIGSTAILQTINFTADRVGANAEYTVSVIKITDANDNSGEIIATIDDNGGNALKITADGGVTVTINDDNDFAADNPLILDAGLYVFMVNPVTDNMFSVARSNDDYDYGDFVRGNNTNIYRDADDKGALDLNLSFKANTAPEFIDAAEVTITNETYNAIEGFVGTYEIYATDDEEFDILTYRQTTEPAIIAPSWLTFDFASQQDTILMTVAANAEVGTHRAEIWVNDGLDSAMFDITIIVTSEDDITVFVDANNDFEETFNTGSVTSAVYEWELVEGENSTENAVAWGDDGAANIASDNTPGEYQDELLVLSSVDNLVYFDEPTADTTYWLEVDFELENLDNMLGSGTLGSGNEFDGYNNADFRILVSDDYGTTWTKLFQEDDTALVEAAGLTYPLMDGGNTAMIDISSYYGRNLLFAFGWEGIATTNGAEVWVDNIKLYSQDPMVDLSIVNYNTMPKVIPVKQVTGFNVNMGVINEGTTASETAVLRANVLLGGNELDPEYMETQNMVSVGIGGSASYTFPSVNGITYEDMGTYTIDLDIDQPYSISASYSFQITEEDYMFADAGGVISNINTESGIAYGQVFHIITEDLLTEVYLGNADGEDVFVEIIELTTADATTGTVIYKSTSIEVDGNDVDIEDITLAPGYYAVMVTGVNGGITFATETSVSNDYTASYIKGNSTEFEVIEDNTYLFLGLVFGNTAPYFADMDGSHIGVYPDQESVLGVPFSMTVRAMDDDADDVASIIGYTVPDWVTVTDNGKGFATITGTPTIDNVGDNLVVLHTSDGSLSQEKTINIVVIPNPAPEFTTAPSLSAISGIMYNYTTTAIDPYGDVVTMTVNNVPAWMGTPVINGNSVTISGIPTAEYADSSNLVKITATDGLGLTTEQIFNINVYENYAPKFVSEPVTEAMVDLEYRYFVKSVDDNNMDILTITGTTLPAWLTIAETSNGRATLMGTPTANGDYDVVLTVADEVGLSDVQSFTITVTGENNAPTFTSTGFTTATEDILYSYDISATDVDGDNLTITGSNIPNWLVLTVSGNGIATLKGVPTQLYVGNNDVSLIVSDGSLSDVQEFTISVTEVDDTPIFKSAAIETATVGDEYSYTVEGWDEEGAELTFEAQLPEWLTMENRFDGVAIISGTPTDDNKGITPIQLTLSDGNSTGEQTFELTVSGAVGLNSNSNMEIELYPNPSNGTFNLKYAEGANIYIYNASGMVVKQIEKATEHEIIDISDFNAGAYILRIITNDKVETKHLNLIK